MLPLGFGKCVENFHLTQILDKPQSTQADWRVDVLLPHRPDSKQALFEVAYTLHQNRANELWRDWLIVEEIPPYTGFIGDSTKRIDIRRTHRLQGKPWCF
jgi:hypothetical protein